MKKIVIVLTLVVSQCIANAQTKWNLDKSHSSVKFVVEHLVISEVEGTFSSFNGNIHAPNSDFTNASVDFIVDVNSINTNDTKRDEHLKSDDFFNVEKYPQMKFKSTSFKKKSGENYTLTGNLTIRDITKPVTFNVIYNGIVKDPWGNIKAGFKASTSINRFDYGLKWNTLTEAGGAVVGKDVAIRLNLEFAKAK